MRRRQPRSTLFPYTTLFRSQKKNPGLIISYTLPVDPKGLSDASQDLLSDAVDRKSTRLNSSHSSISYAVFCLKKKKDIHSMIITELINIAKSSYSLASHLSK